MEIIPAILESNISGFKTKLAELAGFTYRIQVDFNDGSFEGFTSVKPRDIKDLIVGPSALLGASSLELETHLMVQKPRGHEWISELVNSGFRKIIIQYEIEEDVRAALEEVKSAGLKAGLAIGPATSVFEIEPVVELLDTITVMNIEPGKQGQKIMPAELEKIRELKTGGFGGEVQADGGINLENISEVVATGVDTLVVGSHYGELKNYGH